MRRRAAAWALLAALALHSLALRGLRAAYAADGASALALEVEDATPMPGELFRSPIVFVLRLGGAGELFWPGEVAPGPGAQDKDALAGIRRWQIQIYDFDNRKVHFIQGTGPPPSRRIAWDGVDREGRLLRNGFYTARLVWIDASGAARKSEPVKVGLLTSPDLSDFTGPTVRVLYTRDGMVIRLTEALVFDAGQWMPRPEFFATLGKIAAFLQRYPRNRIVVVGHADSIGSTAHNRALSLKRAMAIHRFLVEHDVRGERLFYEGRGADAPIASNSTQKGREQNRRVEIVLLKATI